MKMTRSRFIGRYKQVIVAQYETLCGTSSLPHLTEQTEPVNATTTSSLQPPHPPPSSSETAKESFFSPQNNCLLDAEGGRMVLATTPAMTAGSTNTIRLQEIARILTPHKQSLVLPLQMPELISWLGGNGDLYCGEEGNNLLGNLSDPIIETRGLNSSETVQEEEELQSEGHYQRNVVVLGPKFTSPNV